MTYRQKYLLRAAELSAKAQAENDHTYKIEFQNLARAFLRLAEQAERNTHTDIVYETPPKKDVRLSSITAALPQPASAPRAYLTPEYGTESEYERIIW